MPLKNICVDVAFSQPHSTQSSSHAASYSVCVLIHHLCIYHARLSFLSLFSLIHKRRNGGGGGGGDEGT